MSSSVNALAHNIAATATHVYQSTQNFVEESHPGFLKEVEKIQNTVFPILAGLGTAILLAAQSSVFAIGFLVSIMNPKIIQKSLDRISDIWSKQHIFIRSAIIAAAAVAWPISLAASAFFVGGHLGLSLQSQENKKSS
jgi:hypothetical protein